MDEKKRGRNKPREVICGRCGKVFAAYSHIARFCPDCRYAHKLEQMRERAKKLHEGTLDDSPKPRFEDDGGVKCLFWIDAHPKLTIRCEGGRSTQFPTKEEYRQHMARYCERNPGYKECPFAAELIRRYEEE